MNLLNMNLLFCIKFAKKFFGPGFSHLPARAGISGRVLSIWAGPAKNGPGRVLGRDGPGRVLDTTLYIKKLKVRQKSKKKQK